MGILLLGANGQVGWELRRSLSPLAPIHAFDREQADLADHARLRRIVRDLSPALIVNAAAYTAVDRAEEERDLAFDVNGRAPGILAEEASRIGSPLVHFSTDYVFDGTSDRPAREDDPTAPLNVYGKSKLAGEEAVRGSGCSYLIFRTSWVYSMRGRNFLLTVKRLAGELEELRIVADQIGAPTWARSIAESTALAVARSSGPGDFGAIREMSGIYNMTASGKTSWHGFAEAIVDRLRISGTPMRSDRVVPIATSEYPVPAKRPACSLLDCSKLGETFGIVMPDWREQLQLCVES